VKPAKLLKNLSLCVRNVQ